MDIRSLLSLKKIDYASLARPDAPGERQYFLDRKENVDKGLRIFYWICAALAMIDLVYSRHAVHPFEGWYGFYAIYGFLACFILVFVAAKLRKLLMRGEDYYDNHD